MVLSNEAPPINAITMLGFNGMGYDLEIVKPDGKGRWQPSASLVERLASTQFHKGYQQRQG
jgi:hypothetical protein